MALKEAIAYIPAGQAAITTTNLLYGLDLADATVDTDWLVTANSFTLGTLGAAVDYAVKVQGTVNDSGIGIHDVAVLAGPVLADGVVLGGAPFVLSAFTTLKNGEVVIGSDGMPPTAATITGTANQIIVTNAANSITLSTPQSINTTSSPTFANETLTGNAAIGGALGVTGSYTSTNGNLTLTNGNASFGGTLGAGATTVTSLTASGLIKPQQHTTSGAPAYVKGALHFDTTLNKLRVGGATDWETITSV